MWESIQKLLTSKRSLIVVMTALFDAGLAVALAIGYGIDPAQAEAVWQPIIQALAVLVSALAGALVLGYSKRDPGQLPGGAGDGGLAQEDVG